MLQIQRVWPSRHHPPLSSLLSPLLLSHLSIHQHVSRLTTTTSTITTTAVEVVMLTYLFEVFEESVGLREGLSS